MKRSERVSGHSIGKRDGKKTTRQLSERIEIHYFKQLHPLRKWKRIVCGVAVVLAGAWLLLSALTGDSRPYLPGPLSNPHKYLENNCQMCHQGATGGFFSLSVTDQACEQCHAGSIHHSHQIFQGVVGAQPSCSSCHDEHGGNEVQLALVNDKNCIGCHEDLQFDPAVIQMASLSDTITESPFALRRPPDGYEPSITRFEEDHPEFRLLSEGLSDSAQIKLNHQVHLRQGLVGPEGVVQMECQECHQWDVSGSYMSPINYENHCQSCHPLAFDEHIREQAPHQEPEIVEAFVRIAFSQYGVRNPNEWHQPENWHPIQQLSSLSQMVEEAPRDLPEWLETQIDSSLGFLFEEKCQECHVMNNLGASIPEVVDPAIPALWLGHSRFQHDTHRMLQCISCHDQAVVSTETVDVLIPGRENCLICHTSSVGAPADCATCHNYHDPLTEDQGPGALTPNQMVGE